MLERLKDKVPEIRSQAVTALQRLQDPKDDECPIIKVSPTERKI
jgi:condensin complex subunit 3